MTDASLQTLKMLPSLRHLNINNNRLIVGSNLCELKLNLKSLAIDECDNIKYSNVMKFVSRSDLNYLRIDGKYFSTNQVINLVVGSPNLNQFSISFGCNIHGYFLSYLYKANWKMLRLIKGINFQSNELLGLFSRKMNQLTQLDLTECYQLTDQCLQMVALNCKKLMYLSVSGCRKIQSKGIRAIVEGCSEIAVLQVAGLEFITENAFPLEVTMKNLKKLDLAKCGCVRDRHIWDLHFKYPHALIKNYYGKSVENWKPYEYCHQLVTMVHSLGKIQVFINNNKSFY